MAKCLQEAKVSFEIPPSIRFEGRAGEQRTMFFRDSCGNSIEIKSFENFRKVYE